MSTHTIGTSADFATVQLWEDDIPDPLTVPRVGQVKNQELSSAGSQVDFSNHTTTSTNSITLETVAGASFMDNANVRTNALRYNASNGAALKTTGGYNPTIYVSGRVDHLTIQNIQLLAPGGSSHGECFATDGVASWRSGYLLKNLICEKSAGGDYVLAIWGQLSETGKIINVVCIHRGTGGGMRLYQSDILVEGCTVVAPSNTAPNADGFRRSYGNPIIKSCALFGFTPATLSFGGGGFDASSGHNATDLSSGLPGSNNQHSVSYSSSTPFVNATSASSAHDFRLANDGNALINNGAYDGTNAPNDISGQARSDPPEVGAWELASAAATLSVQVYN